MALLRQVSQMYLRPSCERSEAFFVFGQNHCEIFRLPDQKWSGYASVSCAKLVVLSFVQDCMSKIRQRFDSNDTTFGFVFFMKIWHYVGEIILETI